MMVRSGAIPGANVRILTTVCAILVGAALTAPVAWGADVAAPETDWLDRWGPGLLDLGQGVALDENGNAWITGTAHGARGKDWVTAKYAPDGERLWARVIDRGDNDRGAAVILDGTGGAIVAGTVSTPAGDNGLLRRYDANGSAVWTRSFDKGFSETARALASHPEGGFILGGVVVSMNGGDGFVARFAPDGTETWAKPINIYRHEEVFDVAVGPDGGVVAAGRLLRDNAFDTLVRKFDAGGRTLWTHVATAGGRDEGRGVSVGPEGHVYVSGTVLSGEGNETHLDVSLQKFSPEGDTVWSKRLDLDGEDDEGRDVQVDPSGNLFLTGFGMIRGGKDAFLFKLDPAGNEIWRQTWDGGGTDGTGSIGLSPDGARVLIGGAAQRQGSDYDYLLIHYTQGWPSAAFRVATDGPESGEAVHFEDASAPGKASLTSWHWDFGDGATSADANPSHVYEYGGEYTVRLTVRDAYNSADTNVETIHVEGPAAPVASGDGSGTGDDGTQESQPPAGEQTPGLGLLAVLAAVGVTGFVTRRRER